MKVAAIGAGAIGGWAAAKLALAGNPVMALNSKGALDEIEIVEGGTLKVATLTRFEGSADLLIIAVKAIALAAAADAARAWIGPDTLILPMLNGVPWWFVDQLRLHSIDPDGRIAAALPTRQIIGCVVHASCSRSGNGAVLVKYADKLIIGELGGEDSPRIAHVYSLLDQAGLRPELTANVRRAIWYKLWGNATINPLSALTRAPCDRILAEPELRQWMLEGMAELAAIGAAIGCPITESGEDRIRVTERLGSFKTSMLQDVEAGRRIELEALLGAPREIANRFGISTPALDRIYGTTRLMAESLGLT